MFAGEEAPGERVVGNDAEFKFIAERQKFRLNAAGEQVVHRLDGDDWVPAVLVGEPQHLTELPSRVVGGGDMRLLRRFVAFLELDNGFGQQQVVGAAILGDDAADNPMPGDEIVFER